MSSNNIRTGVIGYGLSGRVFHAPFIDVVDRYELTKISTANTERMALAKQRYPSTEIVPNAEDIINDPNIDLVINTSPNIDHYRWAKQALIAGKHVIVEKPFTVNVAEADDLIELAQKQNKVLSVYQNRRFTSDTKTVKKLLDSGLLGEIVDYEAHYDRYRLEPRPGGSWKEQALTGSGIIYDLGSHLIDQVLWFFGMPTAVTAEIKKLRPWANVDDYFDVRLHYLGFTATLKSSMISRIPGPNYLLHGTNGSFVKYGLDVQEETLDNGAKPIGNDWGKEPEDIWGTIKTEYKGVMISGKLESELGDYREYYYNLRDTINGEAEIAVTAEEGRNVMKIIELAFRSNDEKRTIIVK